VRLGLTGGRVIFGKEAAPPFGVEAEPRRRLSELPGRKGEAFPRWAAAKPLLVTAHSQKPNRPPILLSEGPMAGF